MLDWFFKNKMVTMNEQGEVVRTEHLPKDIVMKEDKDGIIRFYYNYKTCLIPLKEPEK